MHRRSGGQGVVQFARSAHSTEGVAIKFFLNQQAFQCEQELYMRPELRSMMPAITLIESNEAVRTTFSFHILSDSPEWFCVGCLFGGALLESPVFFLRTLLAGSWFR